MRQALLQLKFEPRDERLANLIPDEDNFDLLKDLLPPLKQLMVVSKELSSDSKPTIHMVVPNLVNIGHLDKQYPLAAEEVQAFIRKVMEEVEKRIPDYGRQENLVWQQFFYHLC
jgi:hypothetical protein